MKTTQTLHASKAFAVTAMLAVCATLFSSSANASILNAPAGGTFTMHLDRNALAPYFGYFLSTFWDGAASDISNPANTGSYLAGNIAATEISAVNRVFGLTPVGSDPINQPGQRFVKATSAGFGIDSDTLAGVVGTRIGMIGVQGFYAPSWPPSGGGVLNGDFSVAYDANRQSGGQTGWYLANNIYFTMAVYDFSNVSLAFTDADNWRLSGDLLMSPENGGMLQGASLNDVGDFCLGTGSYAGCGQVSAVPLPAAVWLFGSGLAGFTAVAGRKQSGQQISNRENS
ncbi:VPLPA-CTERM sorting domain-containing protein [Methylomonas rivi]|uniref:VPLPA-CTERM sorting domain-containing protein n=1 Tax=Methylomonas rivi TaxID=2952226 RepID=A0ABT1U095_9GAMM|nr:VPLPA-CTERM sorting domain-containing protein [Methylomonas sp. WSC-6]MCQ8127239.1 VPLPA-CTERM sorting domain-containing protein [Methylomonas sp. WSC-6]